MRHRTFVSTLLVAILCATARVPAQTVPASPFAYDNRAALAIGTSPPHTAGGIDTRELQFDGLAYGRVNATLLRPAVPSMARRAGVLWVHWLGELATTNRTEFLADARALAGCGATSLLIDAMWSRPRWYETRVPANDRRDLVAQVVALRRAFDVLVAERDVDASRIAYVGHDFGAMYGALAVAVDERVRFGVFMTPSPTFWEWMLYAAVPADVESYISAMSAYDLPRWVPSMRLAGSLWQFARRDPYIATMTATGAKAWIPDRDRTIALYDAGHALDVPKAVDDRRAWLAARLRLRSPDPSGSCAPNAR